MAQPHCGTFTLKIGEIMMQSMEKDKDETDRMNNLIKDLKAVVTQ